MKSRPKLTTIAVLAWGAAFALLGASAHAADGAKIAEECDTCHGKDGVSAEAKVPTIAGMSATYISDSMKNYKKEGPTLRGGQASHRPQEGEGDRHVQGSG